MQYIFFNLESWKSFQLSNLCSQFGSYFPIIKSKLFAVQMYFFFVTKIKVFFANFKESIFKKFLLIKIVGNCFFFIFLNLKMNNKFLIFILIERWSHIYCYSLSTILKSESNTDISELYRTKNIFFPGYENCFAIFKDQKSIIFNENYRRNLLL